MYIWNYILSLGFFIMNRLLAFLFSASQTLKKPYMKSTVPSALLIVFIEGHVQYITFTFFRQIFHPHIEVFMDKINLMVAVFFMFIVFIYTISSFVIFSWALERKKFKILFPLKLKSKPLTMFMVMFMGPGRNMLLGLFQALYEDFTLQVSLILCLNFFTLLALNLAKKTKLSKYILKTKFWFIILITIYLLVALLDYHKFVSTSSVFEIVQLICVCGLWAICAMDFCYGFTTFII